MKDVEKFERFEDLKKSESQKSMSSENHPEMAEEFIALLRRNAQKVETPTS